MTATATSAKKKTATAVRSGARGGCFSSADEAREVLDKLLEEIDADPKLGPRLRSTRVPHRLVFPDLDLVVNVTESEQDGHSLRWRFSDEVDWEPALTLEMDSDVANRFLQGRENLAIAIARGQIRASGKSRAALSFVPFSRALFGRYRQIVKRSYPHLLLG